jgi:hypothetical protein
VIELILLEIFFTIRIEGFLQPFRQIEQLIYEEWLQAEPGKEKSWETHQSVHDYANATDVTKKVKHTESPPAS